jgi:PAS domain-containing protein
MNYRKDGKPFMNRFVLLPIRLRGGGRPTHFLSVQKDVTYLRFTEVPPEQWSSAEVEMWLDSIGLGSLRHPTMISEVVDGQMLLEMDAEALELMAIPVEMRSRLNRALEGLRAQAKAHSREGYSKPSDDPSTASIRKSFWQHHGPGSSSSLGEWTALKTYFGENTPPQIRLVPRDVSFRDLKEKLEIENSKALQLFFRENSEPHVISNDDDLRETIQAAGGGTVKIYASPYEPKLSEQDVAFLIPLLIPALVMDSFGRIVFANDVASALLQSPVGRSWEDLFTAPLHLKHVPLRREVNVAGTESAFNAFVSRSPQETMTAILVPVDESESDSDSDEDGESSSGASSDSDGESSSSISQSQSQASRT